jgi:hypothetical protein
MLVSLVLVLSCCIKCRVQRERESIVRFRGCSREIKRRVGGRHTHREMSVGSILSVFMNASNVV